MEMRLSASVPEKGRGKASELDDKDYSFQVGKCVRTEFAVEEVEAEGAEAKEIETADTKIAQHSKWAVAVLEAPGQAAFRYHGFPNATCSGYLAVISAHNPTLFSATIKSYVEVERRRITSAAPEQ
ncbi:hypothetical protein [Candidatus Foliamicus sp.]